MFDKVAALIIKDKKMLLVREKGKRIFLLPGGRRKFGENDETCLKRELREELGVDILEMNYYGKFDELAIISIIAYLCKTDGLMKPGAEIEEMMWADSRTDVKMHSMTKDKIMSELVKEGLIN